MVHLRCTDRSISSAKLSAVFQILLIRHAQSANNALPEPQRVPDPGLTSLGQQQAEKLAAFLAVNPPTHLYCSGFRRALETTSPIARKLSLRPHVRFDLFEQGGCYQGYLPGRKKPCSGLGRSQILARFGDWVIDERIADDGWYHGRELESDEDAIYRARAVARWIVQELVKPQAGPPPPHRPALIIHADFKLLLLEAMLELHPFDGDTPTRIDRYREPWNTSISQLTWDKHGWRLDYWNSTPHLGDDPLPG